MEITSSSSTGSWPAQGAPLWRPPATTLGSLHLAVVVSLGLGAVLWGEALIRGGQGLQIQRYLALLGIYGVLSAAFVASRIRQAKLQLFEIPVFLTCTCFVQFGLVPLHNFIDPRQIDGHLSANGEELVQALAYVILGMVAFWVGCALFRRIKGDRIPMDLGAQGVVPKLRQTSVLAGFGVLFATGFITNVYLLENHLFAYTKSMGRYYENLAPMQVLNFLSLFGVLALIVAAIERYRRRHDPLWGLLFIAALLTEVFWGLISGMKGLILQNFLVVALVSSFVMRKLNLRWFAILFFGLVLLYPFVNAYRMVLNRGNVEVTSFSGAAEAAQMAFRDVENGGAITGDFWRTGMDATLDRLDLLTNVAQILTLGPRASIVKGDVHWWMLPFYPFVPRFIWHSKPLLQEGGWFTIALGRGSNDAQTIGSSTAVTYLGDLYLQFGWLGIPLGMFVLGVVTQWFTNRAICSNDPRNLFLYTSLFLFGFPFEADAFSLWTSLPKLLAILWVVRRAVYGYAAPRRRAASTSGGWRAVRVGGSNVGRSPA